MRRFADATKNATQFYDESYMVLNHEVAIRTLILDIIVSLSV